jgi:hypothetical protein
MIGKNYDRLSFIVQALGNTHIALFSKLCSNIHKKSFENSNYEAISVKFMAHSNLHNFPIFRIEKV